MLRLRSRLNAMILVVAGLYTFALAACSGTQDRVSQEADTAAQNALQQYQDAVIETLGDMVGFRTVHQPGIPNSETPEFQALTRYLEAKASELGLDFEDHGAVVV